jgi:hypothetical protein
MLAERIEARRNEMLEMIACGIRPHVAHAIIKAREENAEEEIKKLREMMGMDE